MPHAWALVDSSFPTFAEDEKTGKKIEKLVDYMKILVEALQYQLENLDAENWNTAALESLETELTGDMEANITLLAQNMAALAGEMTQISAKLSTAEALSGRLKTVEEEMKKLKAAVQADEDGNLSLGAEGKDVHLTGNVYINGKLVE